MIAPERFTIKAQEALQRVQTHAGEKNHQQMTPEHLLLAITGEKESIALKVLETLGVDSLEIRHGILNEINED